MDLSTLTTRRASAEQALSYDSIGNLTGDGTNTYTWDARNHMTAIFQGVAASFVYDAFGRRMSKTISGTTMQFLYDGLNPVQELNSSNVATANLLTGLKIDEFFSRTDSSGARNFLTDILGSTLALTDSSGTIQTQYTYEPFGNVTVSGAANGNSYQFTGRENDGTGLYFYRARYYSPTFQRFVSQDPADFGGGQANLYAYVGNSPMTAIDAFGLAQVAVVFEPVIGPWNHARIVITDTNGAQTVVEGEPQHHDSRLPKSLINTCSGDGWGNLRAQVEPPGEHLPVDIYAYPHQILIDDSLPAKDYVNPLRAYANDVSSANIPYDEWNMNSNSFANSALKGVLGVSTDNPAPTTPGWNISLPIK